MNLLWLWILLNTFSNLKMLCTNNFAFHTNFLAKITIHIFFFQVKPKLTKKQATDFTPINNPQLIPDIFRFHYDHALVCSKCFPRENEGYGNFIVKAALSHQCERNILVVRPKGEKSWSKVRQRTQHAQVRTKKVIFISS